LSFDINAYETIQDMLFSNGYITWKTMVSYVIYRFIFVL